MVSALKSDQSLKTTIGVMRNYTSPFGTAECARLF